MIYIGTLVAVQFVILTAYWLKKNYNPQGVLLLVGVMMLAVSMMMGLFDITVKNSTGSRVFDIFQVITETFSGNLVGIGLMIMVIGGYVSYMKEIKASDALVYVSIQPLSFFRKYPYLAACAVIPIGQVLFVCVPSATGLGLLLAASVLPLLLSLGVSKLTAISVIAATTAFDMGPTSANTAKASEILNMNNIAYFIEHQLPTIIPLMVVMTLAYYFTSKYFDKKDRAKGKETGQVIAQGDMRVNVPKVYALLPLLPLLLLVIFSPYVQIFGYPIELNTTTAMIVSLFIAMIFELVRSRSMSVVIRGIKAFWSGMGDVMANVLTLIVCAEIFSKGLISMGFIEALVGGATHIGMSGYVIAVVMSVMVFLAAMLMGSGNAAFFSFGPLVPGIAGKINMQAIDLILPMQLSTSLGRTASPIAGVIIAISQIAGVSSFEVAKRNMIPVCITTVTMLIINMIF